MPSEKALLVVAVRVDNPPDEVRRRILMILAAAATYDNPPNTSPLAFCQPVEDLTGPEKDALSTFFGDLTNDLNLNGDKG